MSSMSILPPFIHSAHNMNGFNSCDIVGGNAIPSLRFSFPATNWSVEQSNLHQFSQDLNNSALHASLRNNQNNVILAASALLNVSKPTTKDTQYQTNLNSNVPLFNENFPNLTILSPFESPTLPKPISPISSNTPPFSPFGSSENLEQLATSSDSFHLAKENKSDSLEDGKGFTKVPYEKLIHRARRVRKCRVVRGKKPRICHWCNTTVTPEWRCGPDHCMLCNACGLQYRNKLKEEQTSKKKNAVSNLLN